MSQVGLRHVAALAGVSIKTVSNVVNERPNVTADTRARVLEAIRQLDYQPNLYARSLRGGRSGVIALAVPGLDGPYFAELARAVVEAAGRRRWTVFIEETGGEADRELATIKRLGLHLIDGMVFSPLSIGSREIARQKIARPLVMVGERCLDNATDHVAIDNVAAARLATDHLAGLGYRRIAAIGDQPHAPTDTARLRVEGYRESLAAAGLPAIPSYLKAPSGFTREEGRKAMEELLSLPEPPDAVFCFADVLAVGAIRAIYDRGLAVPDDVAVIGFDDVEEGRFSVPSLSTISPDKAQIAEAAVGLLERRLDEPPGAPVGAEEIQIDFELVARESTLRR